MSGSGVLPRKDTRKSFSGTDFSLDFVFGDKNHRLKSVPLSSDIQIPYIEGVVFDEFASRFDGVSH